MLPFKNIARGILGCCLLTPLAIALSTSASLSEEAEGLPQGASEAETVFYCDDKIDPPTTFVNLQGETEPQPFLSWYPQYLLPETSAQEVCRQVSERLQGEYVKGKRYLLAAEQIKEEKRWKICLVEGNQENCQSDKAIELFSVNNLYRNTPKCITENREPNTCPSTTRGSVLSIPADNYTPFWWPFR